MHRGCIACGFTPEVVSRLGACTGAVHYTSPTTWTLLPYAKPPFLPGTHVHHATSVDQQDFKDNQKQGEKGKGKSAPEALLERSPATR